jgi:hypothetical protein
VLDELRGDWDAEGAGAGAKATAAGRGVKREAAAEAEGAHATGAQRRQGGAEAEAPAGAEEHKPRDGDDVLAVAIRAAHAAVAQLPLDETPGVALHFVARYARDCGVANEADARAPTRARVPPLPRHQGGRARRVAAAARWDAVLPHAPALHALLRALLRRHGARLPPRAVRGRRRGRGDAVAAQHALSRAACTKRAFGAPPPLETWPAPDARAKATWRA